MTELTKPNARLDRLQPVRALPSKRRSKKRKYLLVLLALIAAYFIAPLRTNILFLGTDISPERGNLGRTDTIILATVVPLKPYLGMLSIPRDLWVQVPGVGEQRINTSYFYSEANQAGSGGEAALLTIRENFGVPIRYYVVIHMQGLVPVIDSLGGVDVHLDSPTGGLPAGTHHLDGYGALAFARNRSAGDDFGRMRGAQVLISAVLKKTLQPASWRDLPRFVFALSQTVETNIPLWQAPRLLFALMRAPLFGFDSRTITREMVTPFTTSQGAQVLLPNWEAIRPTLREMFGR
jgi:LCP family protein required for cell wall assembly